MGTSTKTIQYRYDSRGNRRALIDQDGGPFTYTYRGFAATEETIARYASAAPKICARVANPKTVSFHDPSGNRLLKIHDGARTTSTYDAANQLVYSHDVSGRTTYTFDADGNQQVVRAPNGERTTYVWEATEAADRRGRREAEGGSSKQMTSAQLPSGVRNTMAYDADGLRMKLEESTGTKKFVWEATEAADRLGRMKAEGGSFNYLAETDAANDTQVVYTNEPRLYGNLISQRRGSDSHWYHFDAIGSTRELTNSSAVITDTRLYDAWGVTQSISGSTVFAFCYVGKLGYFLDVATGELYVKQRRYRPAIGRWESIDRLQLLLRLNAYVYAKNCASNRVDPSGLLCQRPVTGALPDWFDPGIELPMPPYEQQIVGHCGTHAWTTQWVAGENEFDGLIVQKVCVSGGPRLCPGASCQERVPPADICDARTRRSSDCPNDCYLEVWRMQGQRVFGLNPFDDPPQQGAAFDTFAWLGCSNECTDGCTYGSITRTGEAFFIPDSHWRAQEEEIRRIFACGPLGIRDACKLCSGCYGSARYEKLKALSVGDVTTKSAKVEWDCCTNNCGVAGCNPECPTDSAEFTTFPVSC